jgi:hypothetical protein
MSDDNVLRERVRDAIQAGNLPNRAPDRLWGGPGTGARCAVCGESTIEGEVEFVYDNLVDRKSYYAHPRCLHVFETEVQKLAGATALDARLKDQE